jgi:hypothetical protein
MLSQKTRSILLFYCWWNSTLTPLVIPAMIYVKTRFWAIRGSIAPHDPILILGFISFKVFLVLQVFIIYRKLESKFIDRWREFQIEEECIIKDENCGGGKMALNHDNDFGREKEEVKGHEGFKVTQDDFKGRIISPLCLSIGKSNI